MHKVLCTKSMRTWIKSREKCPEVFRVSYKFWILFIYNIKYGWPEAKKIETCHYTDESVFFRIFLSTFSFDDNFFLCFLSCSKGLTPSPPFTFSGLTTKKNVRLFLGKAQFRIYYILKKIYHYRKVWIFFFIRFSFDDLLFVNSGSGVFISPFSGPTTHKKTYFFVCLPLSMPSVL